MPGKNQAVAGMFRRHRAPLLWLLAPYLAGLVLGRWGWTPSAQWGLAFVGGALLGAGRPRWWAPPLLAAMIVAGACRYRQAAPPPPPALTQGRFRRGAAERVTVIIERAFPSKRTVTHTRRPGPNPPRTAGAIARILAAEPDRGLAGQQLYCSFGLADARDEPTASSVVRLAGRVRAVPSGARADSFFGYLDGLAIPFEMSGAVLTGVAGAPTPYASAVAQLARRLGDALARSFEHHPDLLAIYRAMMLGDKSGLSAAQKAIFVRTGTMHLFAINGLHIGIVALAAHAVLGLLRVPRPAASLVTLAILWTDVEATGGSPSAVRAFLMIATLESGRALALAANPLSALAFAALVVSVASPAEVFGASFQMSFSVVAVLLTLGVPLAALAGRPPTPEGAMRRNPAARAVLGCVRHLRTAAAFGAAAATVSTVTGIEYFRTWAPIGFAANLAIMPLATLIIVAGFAAIVSALVHCAAACAIFDGAARVLLQLTTRVLGGLADVPGGSLSAAYRAAWIGPAALVALLACCFYGYAMNWSDERTGRWWPPFALVAVVLLVGVA